MAIFHSHVQIIGRGKGKSAVAAAAYRAGEAIKNEYDGVLHDFTRKKGVVHRSILLPDHAPKAYNDRGVLWNAVEKIEKAENAQLARELEIALPIEFTREQNIALAREYVQSTFVSAGMCADLCVHDVDGSNPHMHIMLTVRPIMPDGKWGSKQKKEYILDHDGNKIYNPQKRQYKCRSIPSTDWNSYTKADEWRKAWEDMANAELERRGFDSRIDRRSYEEQGIELVPSVHLGTTASQMEKCGIRTERGNINRQIEITNKEIRQLRARINKLDKWIADEIANPKPPTLADIIEEVMTRQGQSSQKKKKNGAEIFNFLMRNKVYDMADLEQKVNAMHRDVNSMSDNLKKVERRIDTLHEHLRHSDNFKKYRKHKRKYESLYSEYEAAKKSTGFGAKRKANKALASAKEYHEQHRAELAKFSNAEKYLRDVLQDRFDPKKLPPISKWQNELSDKTAEKDALYREYYALKDETHNVEKIRASVKAILHSDTPKQGRQKSWDIEM
jgi:hypothetical protein